MITNPLFDFDTGYVGLALSNDAYAFFHEGRTNGIITDNQRELIDILLEREVVTYVSKKERSDCYYGSYMFDADDLVEV